MILEELNDSFIYKSETIEDWTIPVLSDDGKYYNDCDGYSLLIYFKVDELEDKQIYTCKCNGEGHAICKVGDMYIDNIQKKLVTEEWMLANGYTDLESVSTFKLYAKIACSYLGLFKLKYALTNW